MSVETISQVQKLDSGFEEVTLNGGAKGFTKESVNKALVKGAISGEYINRRVKSVSNDIEEATGKIERLNEILESTNNRLIETVNSIEKNTDRTSQRVRQSSDKLSKGLQRIESQADFNKLERYVDLLERASSAMSSLADLHDSGKLEKIANSLK